jgi:hypothetical protein
MGCAMALTIAITDTVTVEEIIALLARQIAHAHTPDTEPPAAPRRN